MVSDRQIMNNKDRNLHDNISWKESKEQKKIAHDEKTKPHYKF